MIATKERENEAKLGISFKLTHNPSINKDFLFTTEVIDSVKNILGLDFYGIAKFVEKEIFRFNENKCTILVTRRCSLLVDWFIGYLLHENYNDGCKFELGCVKNGTFPFVCVNGYKNFIISDKANISYLLIKEKIAKISILDDICIHGVSLYKIASRIEDNLEDLHLENILIERSVYMISKETINEYPDKCSKVSLKAGWVSLSRSILDFINFLNLPYASYLESFTIPEFQESNFVKLIEDLKTKFICIEFDKENRRLGKCSYFIIEKNILLKQHELIRCIRIYYSAAINSLCIMPYVVLESMEDLTNSDIRELFKYYTGTEKSIKIDRSRLDFYYSLLSCIASKVYFERICAINNEFKKLKDMNPIQDSIGCLEKYFGFDILNRLDKISYIPEQDIIVDKCNQKFDEAVFKKFLQQTLPKIEEVCIKSWLNFELSGSDLNDRKDDTGYISLKKLIENYIKQQGIEETDKNFNALNYACLLNILEFCDQGKLNITCIPSRGESLLKAGELGCLCVNKIIFNSNYKSKIQFLLNYSYYRYLFM
ncbi:MAG: hypothetical protein NC485_14405 [Ruminococcus flavefaciens]|nr:hypothetical protein [Ruminococcus flavefaciens]